MAKCKITPTTVIFEATVKEASHVAASLTDSDEQHSTTVNVILITCND